ncbi:snRNA-activating protein complex subunit 3-like [Ctenocephalides felis]|uniref:snRNA-activating protein complex subunit 3-like n=1 Tax=Ctenocephalides felis TaxID=7515 RepID=UPI000E6E1497|nr:snRNA-activating protein complex subunit 3-like [Ctenocephalides felis]
MDSYLVYEAKKVKCSKPLHIGQTFVDLYGSFLADDARGDITPVNETKQNQIQNCLQYYNKFISSEELEDLERRCNPDLLKSDSDPKKIKFEIYKARKLYSRQDPDPDAKLETLKNFKKFMDLVDNTNKNVLLTAERYLKYRSVVSVGNERCEESISHSYSPIITIRSHYPFRHELRKKNTRGVPKLDREFKILGTTKLTEFRDALSCRQDLDTGEEKSKDPNKSTTPDTLGPALFYINGIIYIDDRYPYEDGFDYTDSLKDWGLRKGMDVRVYDMSTFCFNDIYMRLGYPNLYQHRGCCEHLFVFSDIECTPSKMFHSVTQYNYPLVSAIYLDYKTYCMMCFRYMGSWVTLNSKRTMTEEMLWCAKCFWRFNYTEDHKKIGEFHAYKYFS